MKTYIVGGYVRDELLGLSSNDVDYVVVGSTPEKMLSAGYKSVGKDFPVFICCKTGEEYALARTENSTGEGHKDFSFCTNGVSLNEDLYRRDLTINAMAKDELGNLYDPYMGKADLENKVLRHVSDKFSEDPLRVFRLARFSAKFGPEWKIAEETKEMCKNIDISSLSNDRIYLELRKALKTDYPELFFKTLVVLGHSFPEICDENIEFLELISREKFYTFKYGIVALTYSNCNVDSWCKRFRIDSKTTKYAKTFQDCYDVLCDFDTHSPAEIVTLMKKISYDPVFFAVIANFICKPNFNMSKFAYVFNSVESVRLTTEQMTNLKGSEIGKLYQLRREEAVNKVLTSSVV